MNNKIMQGPNVLHYRSAPNPLQRNCNCGSDCKCDSSSKCGMYPDIENTTTTTIIAGVAPPVNITLRDRRRALEQKEGMVASADQTASVTLVPVKMNKNGSQAKQRYSLT
ncbi:unnamed protein product [Camellia sinensis]